MTVFSKEILIEGENLNTKVRWILNPSQKAQSNSVLYYFGAANDFSILNFDIFSNVKRFVFNDIVSPSAKPFAIDYIIGDCRNVQINQNEHNIIFCSGFDPFQFGIKGDLFKEIYMSTTSVWNYNFNNTNWVEVHHIDEQGEICSYNYLSDDE